MNINSVFERGSITIDDDYRFKYHVEILKLFGKNLKAHMRATSRLDDNWLVWFPKFYKNRDFINELLNDGKKIQMRQLPGSEIISDKTFPDDDPGERIVFAHIQDPITNEKYYKFVGIYSELKGSMKLAAAERIGTTMYLDGKGSYSTVPFAP